MATKKYQDAIVPTGGRKYKITTGSDGLSTIEDKTAYTRVGSSYTSEDILAGTFIECDLKETMLPNGDVRYDITSPNKYQAVMFFFAYFPNGYVPAKNFDTSDAYRTTNVFLNNEPLYMLSPKSDCIVAGEIRRDSRAYFSLWHGIATLLNPAESLRYQQTINRQLNFPPFTPTYMDYSTKQMYYGEYPTCPSLICPCVKADKSLGYTFSNAKAIAIRGIYGEARLGVSNSHYARTVSRWEAFLKSVAEKGNAQTLIVRFAKPGVSNDSILNWCYNYSLSNPPLVSEIFGSVTTLQSEQIAFLPLSSLSGNMATFEGNVPGGKFIVTYNNDTIQTWARFIASDARG